MNDVTRILSELQAGNNYAASELLPIVYDELRKLAARKLVREQPGQTLQATALVHEVYLRLLGPNAADDQNWESRGHFFAAAAEAMRRILIDQARHKKSMKAGGQFTRQVVDEIAADDKSSDDLLALDEALLKLESIDPRKAQLVKLRYFAGLTIAQAAEALGIADSTANADWAYAKSWLRLEIGK